MMTTFEKVVLLSSCLLVQAQAPLQILINSLQMSRAIMPPPAETRIDRKIYRSGYEFEAGSDVVNEPKLERFVRVIGFKLLLHYLLLLTIATK